MATQRIPQTTPSRWLTVFGKLTIAAAVLAVAVFIIDYGFFLTASQKFWVHLGYGVLAGAYIVAAIVQVIFRDERWDIHLRKNAFMYLMSILMVLGFLGLLITQILGVIRFS
jgi:hypothetical protein